MRPRWEHRQAVPGWQQCFSCLLGCEVAVRLGWQWVHFGKG